MTRKIMKCGVSSRGVYPQPQFGKTILKKKSGKLADSGVLWITVLYIRGEQCPQSMPVSFPAYTNRLSTPLVSTTEV
jgi:hypothetical protein